MQNLSPSMFNVLDDMLKPLEGQVKQLQTENARLQRELNEAHAGSTNSRNSSAQLESQLREEILKNQNLIRKNMELESNLQFSTSKMQSLESELSRVKSDMTSNDREKKNVEDQVNQSRLTILDLEEKKEQQRNEIAKLESEKDRLTKQIREITLKNEELNDATEKLSKINDKIGKRLIEKNQIISKLEDNLKDSEDENQRLRKIIGKIKKGSSSAAEGDKQNETLDTTINYGNVQGELEDSREIIKELKVKLLALQDVDSRNDKLIEAVNRQKAIIENLKKEIDDKEKEISEFYRSKSELIQQVETYRERIDEAHHENLDELEELRKQVIYYKENFELADKRVRKFETESNRKMKENEELKQLLDKKLEGTHGLRHAVNEMKELRAMLDVRDRHIAELVAQLNSMDKIMMGLSKKVDPNFDLNEFLKNYDTEDLDEEKLRTEKAARDLAKKIQMMKDRGPAAQIRVVLNKDQRPIKTIVYEGNEETFSLTSPQYKNKNGENNQSDSIWIPPNQRHKMGQKRFKPNHGEEESEKTKTIPNYTDSYAQTEKGDFGGLDGLADDDDEEFKDGFGDRDEWVVNLRRKLLAAKQEIEELKRRLEELTKENEKLSGENKALLASSGKGNFDRTMSKSSFNLDFHSGIKDERKANLTDRSAQTKKPKFMIDDNSLTFKNFSKKLHLQKVYLFDSELNSHLQPSEEERAIFKAKQDALRKELEKVRKESIEFKHQVDDLSLKLQQQLEIQKRMQEMIDRLNKLLNEERETHKERISQLRNEVDVYADSKVREAINVNQVQNRLGKDGLPNLDGPNLDNVSTRMNELNHMKSRLEDQLNEEKASSQLAQKQAANYRDRLIAAEAERDKLKEELQKRKMDNKLTDYNAELHIRMRNLEKKYHDLKRENMELKQSRPARNDPKQGVEHPIDESDNEGDTNFKSFNIRNSKTAEAKIMALKTQNEEMQLKLGKAQGTIDRLNQLLQRKEGQVEKLKEQASSFKHQIIAKQKEVNSLKAKLQS